MASFHGLQFHPASFESMEQPGHDNPLAGNPEVKLLASITVPEAGF